jgi:glycosyltransferase involved in cell wall biosynthesis
MNTRMNSSIAYVVISPVRNEENYVQLTLNSMVNQTCRPEEWILVDDGSTDSTAAIVRDYISRYPWIKLVSLADRGYYFPGTGVVNVFNQGFQSISTPAWKYVVKLDVDLSFGPDYFEQLLARMERDKTLGIASGWPELPHAGGWKREEVQPDHPTWAVCCQCLAGIWQTYFPLNSRAGKPYVFQISLCNIIASVAYVVVDCGVANSCKDSLSVATVTCLATPLQRRCAQWYENVRSPS